MQTNYYDCAETLIENISEDYYSYLYEKEDDFCGINIIGHYDIIVDILNQLIKCTKFRICDVELSLPEVDGYEDEYILSIDYDGEIWCQKAKYDDNYLYTEAEITYVHNDVSSKFVAKNKGSHMVAFTFDKEDIEEKNEKKSICKCNNDCKDNTIVKSIGEDGKLHGFSASRCEGDNYYGYSFYTSDEVDKTFIENLLREFGF